jgi:hypothetical protein
MQETTNTHIGVMMQLTENQIRPELDPAMIESLKGNIADDINCIPLIKDDDPILDAAGIMQFMLTGNSDFRLQDGFSIEYNFSVHNGVGRGNVPVRFIKLKEQSGRQSYCGVIYCNENGRFYYHQSTKSLKSPHVQRLLKVLINNLKENTKPSVNFIPNNHLISM